MYDKVQRHWANYIEGLRASLRDPTAAEERGALQETIQYMEETNMAVVVSQSQNEIDDLRTRGVEITTHRQRMNTEDLDTKFKASDDPFRIVFVCAMLMTGFRCSSLLDDISGQTTAQPYPDANYRQSPTGFSRIKSTA